MEPILLEQTQFRNFAETGYHYHLTRGHRLYPVAHRHNFYELFFLLGGEILHSFDSQKARMTTGDLIFLSPGNVHQLLQQSSNTNIFSLSVSCERFEAFSRAFEYTPRFGAVYHLPVQTFSEQILQLFSLSSEDSPVLSVGILFSRFLTAAAQHDLATKQGIPSQLSHAVAQFNTSQYIGSGVNGLVQLSGYSRAQLNRLIQKHYHTTPHHLLLDIQLHRAIELIEHTDLSFDEIADQIGFRSPSRFYTVIKERYGCSPGAIRHAALHNL